MIHQVAADRGVQTHLKRDLQLGADAIHTRNQHWIGVFCLVHGEQPAKAPNFAEHAARESLMRQVLDALLGAVGAADVYAGIGVGDRCRAGRGSLGHRFLFRELLSILRGVNAGR